jgi:hypothetical protein
VRTKFGKLGNYYFMKRFDSIKPFLPETRVASKSNLISMLKLYHSLYLKPDKGTGGNGIYKIIKFKGRFILRSGTSSRQYDSFNALYNSLHKLLSKNKYVVQKGIDLLRHNKRPFDIRVMVQMNKNKKLVVTGIIGRLAKPKKIVTNYHSGGTPLEIGALLKSHLSGASRSRCIKKIEAVGKQASVVLGESHRNKRAFGVDIAIDSTMKPWILEVNTKPDMTIFNALKNKSMYRNVLKYSRIKG